MQLLILKGSQGSEITYSQDVDAGSGSLRVGHSQCWEGDAYCHCSQWCHAWNWCSFPSRKQVEENQIVVQRFLGLLGFCLWRENWGELAWQWSLLAHGVLLATDVTEVSLSRGQLKFWKGYGLIQSAMNPYSAQCVSYSWHFHSGFWFYLLCGFPQRCWNPGGCRASLHVTVYSDLNWHWQVQSIITRVWCNEQACLLG